MAATVLYLGGVFVVGKKKKQLVDVNHVHVSLAHFHSSVLYYPVSVCWMFDG